MSAPASVPQRLGWRARAVVTLLLAFLAVVGNVLNAPLVYGVHFIFGSVAVVLAVRLLGTWPALLVASIGGGYTWVLWGHPYALVILLAEALVLSVLHRRGWRNLVLADLTYWLVLGMALVLLFYRGVMGMDSTASLLVAIKQALNGVFNALLAGVIVLVLQSAWGGMRRFGLTGIRLVDLLFHALLTTALLAGAVPMIMNSRVQHEQQEAFLKERLDELSLRLAHRIESFEVADPLIWQDLMEDEGRTGLVAGVVLLGADGQVLAQVGDVRSLTPGFGGLIVRDDGMAVWKPGGQMSIMKRWASGRYRVEAPVHVTLPPARLVVESPAEPLVRAVERQTLDILVFLAALMLAGIALSRGLSQWLARPLSLLDAASGRLTEQIARGEHPVLPGSQIKEYGRLAGTLQDMSDQLVTSFARLRQSQSSLERQVQQRTAELNQFKATLDKTLDGVFIIDAETLCFVYANEGARRLSGYSDDELLRLHPYDLVPDLDEAAFLALVAPLRAGQQPALIMETVYRDRHGRRVEVEVFLQHVRVADEPARFVNIVRDISERKRIERMKNEFLSTVSHELRTPLTSIAGVLGLMRSGALGEVTPKAREMLEVAIKNSERLTYLINDLLDLEKMEAGQLYFDMRDLVLQHTVRQAVEHNQSLDAGRGVRIALSCPDEPALHVRADEQRIMQVLSNLLSNAVKYSPDGATVAVAVERDGEWVRVTVTDSGPGVPQAFHGRIFGKFAQADSSDTRQRGGTGLGLAISKELVERMNGRIGFDSVEGRGARFHVELPLSGSSRTPASRPSGGASEPSLS